MERDSFIFYKSFMDAGIGLSYDDRISFYDKIIRYGLYGEEIPGTPVVEILFKIIKPIIDSNNKKYFDGLKGGRPKKGFQTITTGSGNSKTTGSGKPKPNDKDKDNDKEKDTDSFYSKNYPTNQAPAVAVGVVASGGPAGGFGSWQGIKLTSLAEEFKIVVAEYPGTRTKHTAIKEYEIIRQSYSFAEIMDGIKNYIEYIAENNVVDKYIKGLQNYLVEKKFLEYQKINKPVPGTKEHYKRYLKHIVGKKEYESLLGFGKQIYTDLTYNFYLMIEEGYTEKEAKEAKFKVDGMFE